MGIRGWAARGVWVAVGMGLAACSGGAGAGVTAPDTGGAQDAGSPDPQDGGGGNGSSSGGGSGGRPDAGSVEPAVLRNVVVTSGEHRILALAAAPQADVPGVTAVLMSQALPDGMRVSLVRVDMQGTPLESPVELWSGGTGATPVFHPDALLWDLGTGLLVAHFEVTEWDGTQTVLHRLFTRVRPGEAPETVTTHETGEGTRKLVRFQIAGRGYLRILASAREWTVEKLGPTGYVENAWTVDNVAPPGADTQCAEASGGYVCVTPDGQRYVHLVLGALGQLLGRTELPLAVYATSPEQWVTSGLIRLRRAGNTHQLLWNHQRTDNPRRVDLELTTLSADGTVQRSESWAENAAWYGAQGDLGDPADEAGPGWSVWSASAETGGFNASVRGKFTGVAGARPCDLSDLPYALDRAVASPVTVPLRGLGGPAWAVLWADARQHPNPVPGQFETTQLVFQRLTDACPTPAAPTLP